MMLAEMMPQPCSAAVLAEAELGLDGDLTAEHLGEPARDGQSEARAAVGSCVRSIHLSELLEDELIARPVVKPRLE